jgi:hypothetical protein
MTVAEAETILLALAGVQGDAADRARTIAQRELERAQKWALALQQVQNYPAERKP